MTHKKTENSLGTNLKAAVLVLVPLQTSHARS